VTTWHPVLNSTPKEPDTVQMIPIMAWRNVADTSEGQNTASPLPFPVVFVLMAAVYQPTLTFLNEIVKYPVHRWTPLMSGRIA
jgi:hypothetical protein